MLQRATIDGIDLEYELRGTGEPVELIHWGVGAVWAGPPVTGLRYSSLVSAVSAGAVAMSRRRAG